MSGAFQKEELFGIWQIDHPGHVLIGLPFLLCCTLDYSKMIIRRLFLLALASVVAADQGYYYADDGYVANADDGANREDDAVGDDDAAQQYYYANLNQSKTNGYFSAGDNYIKYWTDYAILPKRCIV